MFLGTKLRLYRSKISNILTLCQGKRRSLRYPIKNSVFENKILLPKWGKTCGPLDIPYFTETFWKNSFKYVFFCLKVLLKPYPPHQDF